MQNKFSHIFILFLAVFFAVSTPVWAQKNNPDPKMFKEIQEFKLKYLSQEMDLSPDQAEKFTPLFFKFEEERHQILRSMKEADIKLKEDKNLSDKEYSALSEQINDAKIRDAQLQKDYDAKFSQFLSPKQIVKMKEARETFRNKMREMRHKHRNGKGGKHGKNGNGKN